RGTDLAEPLGRGTVGLRQGVALGEDQEVILVEVGERLRAVEIFVPRLELAGLEGAAAAVRRHPQLAVPGARIGGPHQRERRALLSLVTGDRQEQRAWIARLREYEIGRVGEIFLVVACLGDGAFGAAAQPDVETAQGSAVERNIGLLHHAGQWPDL